MYNKEEEYKTWLVEECKINPETLSKDQTKKYFARYMEDYNTGKFLRVLDRYPNVNESSYLAS